MKGLTGGCVPEGTACLDVIAAPGATGATSTSWLESGSLELCIDREVPKVLLSAVGCQVPLFKQL